MFAKNGFQNVAERIRLGRYLLDRFTNSNLDTLTPAERMRMAFEELGPTFVKLGQLLATRPDLAPPEFVDEFKKLHDQVASVPFEEIKQVLVAQFGKAINEVFVEIDPIPLAAASIAQVHRAVLRDGSEVVVKVQRPGIERIIVEDVSILFYIAELLERYAVGTRVYNPVGIVDEFYRSLEQETNFVVEANNIRRFQENFKNEPSIKIPNVYWEYSGPRVLVLEALKGLPYSQMSRVREEIDRKAIMRVGLRAYFKMVFRDGFFHGDLHAGNLFIMPENKIGLIDFGIVGRLNRRTQDAIANMFLALYTEDYERFAYEFVELAPFNEEVDVDDLAKDLKDLLAPYLGLSLKNVDVGRLLMDSASIAAKHRLVLPAELVLFFKSIVTVEAMAQALAEDFNLLEYAVEFAEEIVQTRYSPERVREELLNFGRDSSTLLKSAPRYLKQFVRKVGHPDFAFRLSLVELEDLKHSIHAGAKTLVMGIVIASLILGSSILMSLTRGPFVGDLPVASVLGYSLAAVLSFFVFLRK